MNFKLLSKADVKELLDKYKGKIITPYENAEDATGWVFVVIVSVTDTNPSAYYFFGVDHFTNYEDGTTKVEWYPAGMYVPTIIKNVVMYYPIGWVGS